jgi:hypothetical protein
MSTEIEEYKPAESTLSTSSWQLAEKWLNQCRENHHRCAIQTQEFWVPSRLIDIGSSSEIESPRLRVFPDHKGTAPYVTLSHCWGSLDMFKLKTANIESLTTSISLKMLPRSFKDAIFIAKRFGFGFLWIDSLCIMQDSKEDWFREASLMSDVYTNSSLTIAATSASDGSGGCFFMREPDSISPSRIELMVKPGRWSWEEKGGLQSLYLIDSEPSMMSQLSDAPLNRRAWAFQERILSPRVLHFSRNQLFWECRKLEACESYPRGLSRNIWRDGPHVKSIFGMEGLVMDDTYALPLGHWAWIVETFTRGALTVLSDKLVALAGIATEVQRLLKDDYLAGLWRRSLLDEMLWVVKDDDSFRPSIYRAPSWSWASVEGAISYDICTSARGSEIFFEEATVTDAQVTGADVIHGQITAGFVILQGKVGLCKWKLEPIERKIWSSFLHRNYNNCSIGFTEIQPWGGQSEIEYNEDHNVVYNSSYIVFDVFNESNRPPEVLFIVPLVGVDETTRNVREWPTINGVVLNRTRDGKFQRLGVFDVTEQAAGILLRDLPQHTIAII